jgi:MoaA/NifB/PqqE/SkfB family radical SAM enzyme
MSSGPILNQYSARRRLLEVPRLPLEGYLDLTYRCNHACLHCWLWRPPSASELGDELTLEEIQRLADEARALGTRRWSISGGEPMLRPDFSEIFDCLTRKSVGYSLNTNGTFITPEIAKLLTRQGRKMIALYGATAEVYDAVTRHSGGFERVMQGFAYLREAGAGFIVQLVPMRANWHQWKQMQELAQSLSPHWRVGAPWLYLSSQRSTRRNEEIAGQRLAPRDVIELDEPTVTHDERPPTIPPGLPEPGECPITRDDDDRLFADCIAARRDFHIDPYGMMSWCLHVRDPALRYDLRRGTLREAWEEFIPSLADQVRGGDEYRSNCGACERRADCRWCAAYAYLETGRYSAPIPYLCAVAEEAQRYKQEWPDKHRRYFQIAGINVLVESDLNFGALEFKAEFRPFAVDGPGKDNIIIRHYFELPDMQGKDLGQELYRQPPWAISRRNGMWFYRGIQPDGSDSELHRLAIFNDDHTHLQIYSPPGEVDHIGGHGWHSLSLLPTDQIWLAPLLANRQAALFHAAAAILNGKGLLFVGHSDAGKSTTVKMLKNRAEILCDDRNIARRWDEGWRVHGTWSHGEVAEVSSASAPLGAILFLQQDTDNAIIPLTNRKVIWQRLLATLIRPMVTAEWWQKELDVLERLVDEVPCYTMHFEKSGAIVAELENLTRDLGQGRKAAGATSISHASVESHE